MKDIDLINEFTEFMHEFIKWPRKVTYEEYERLRNDLLTKFWGTDIVPQWVVRCQYGSQVCQMFKSEKMWADDKRQLIASDLSHMLIKLKIYQVCNSNYGV